MTPNMLLELARNGSAEEINNIPEPSFEQALFIREKWDLAIERFKESGTDVLSDDDIFHMLINAKLVIKCKNSHPEVFL